MAQRMYFQNDFSLGNPSNITYQIAHFFKRAVMHPEEKEEQ